LWQFTPTWQMPHLTRPRSSHWPGSARPGLPLAPPAVVAADPPGRFEGLLVEEGGHRDGDPVLARAGDLAAALAGARVGGGFGAVGVDAPDVGLVAQQVAQRGGSPQPIATGRGWDLVGGQPTDDLSQGVPAVDVVVEDPPHDRGLGFEHLESGRAVRVAGLAAVAVGGAPGQHLSGAGAKQLPASIPFGDLRPLVFGDHALDLGEQLGLRVVVQGWGVGESHADPVAGQLVEHDDLVGVDAGEPVRGQAPDSLNQPGLCGVA
jgi:hypothetical protein